MKKIKIFFLIVFALCQYGKCQIIDSIEILDRGQNVYDLEFGNSSLLYSLNDENCVQVYNTDSLKSVKVYDIMASSMAVANTSEMLILGNSQGKLIVFKDNKKIKEIKTHNRKITRIEFDPSDQYFASSGMDSVIKIWSAKTFIEISEINTGSDLITDLAFSLDGKYFVYSTNTGKITIWNVTEKKIQNSLKTHDGWIRDIAISPDSTKFASCGDDKTITIYSFGKSEHYKLNKSHRNIISGISFLNTDYVISIGHDNRIVMNNINYPVKEAIAEAYKGYPRHRRFFFEFPGDKYMNSISISQKSKTIAVASLGNGIILTDYFYKFIEKPQEVVITEIDNIEEKLYDGFEYEVKNNVCAITGEISRYKTVKNVWLYYISKDAKAKLKCEKHGEFEGQIALYKEADDYEIIIEDFDENLEKAHFKFRIIKEE